MFPGPVRGVARLERSEKQALVIADEEIAAATNERVARPRGLARRLQDRPGLASEGSGYAAHAREYAPIVPSLATACLNAAERHTIQQFVSSPKEVHRRPRRPLAHGPRALGARSQDEPELRLAGVAAGLLAQRPRSCVGTALACGAGQAGHRDLLLDKDHRSSLGLSAAARWMGSSRPRSSLTGSFALPAPGSRSAQLEDRARAKRPPLRRARGGWRSAAERASPPIDRGPAC